MNTVMGGKEGKGKEKRGRGKEGEIRKAGIAEGRVTRCEGFLENRIKQRP